MRTLYLECNMGAAGDMLMAALLELHNDPKGFVERLNAAGVPGVCVTALPSVKCGITGTHMAVKVRGEEEESMDVSEHVHDHDHDHGHTHSHTHNQAGHHHSGLHDIGHIIDSLRVSDKVKKDALAVYKLIAEAESHAHGAPVDEIHFHEVGAMDAVADIVGVCMLMEELAPEAIWASAVHVGSGQVRCQHGVLPVPAPATAHILRGVPMVGGSVRGELCTPTGAALLKYFVREFAAMPVMTVDKIGYGMGKKDFEAANCVRAFWGTTRESGDEVVELVCSLDDMTPEAVAFAQQLLLEEGALDVYTTSIGMKKGRVGILLTCMCKSGLADKMAALLFKHTTTIGMREYVSRRRTLRREANELQTPYGRVRTKTSSGYGVTKSKPEFEDIAKIARQNNLSLNDVLEVLRQVDCGSSHSPSSGV